MSGASSAMARREPIARQGGSEVMPPILPLPGPARHWKPACPPRLALEGWAEYGQSITAIDDLAVPTTCGVCKLPYPVDF